MTKETIRNHCTRYAVNVPFTYQPVNGDLHKRENGWTRDLNFRGAWVELPGQVEPGNTLKIALATPQRNLSLLAHVAWTQLDLPAAPYLHGLRFTGVTPDQRDRLSTLLAHSNPLPVRLYCALAATCQRKGVGRVAIRGTTRDLSEDGACVRLPEPLTPGTELCIRAKSQFGEIAAEAQVVWADQVGSERPRDASYRHGLRFLHLHPLSERPLRAFLDGIR